MEDIRKLKLAIIAGGSRALKYKEQNPAASESEVMNDITRNIKEIIRNISDED